MTAVVRLPTPPDRAAIAYRLAAEEHEADRIEREAFLMAWPSFNVVKMRRYLGHAENVFAGRTLTQGEQRDLAIVRRAVEIAENYRNEHQRAAE